MRNRIILGIVSIVMIATIVFIGKIVMGTIDTKPDEKANITHDTKGAARVSLKETRYISQRTKEISTFPKECANVLNELAGLTMEEIMVRLKSKVDFDLFFDPNCQEQLKSHKLFLTIANNSQCQFLQQDFVPSEMCSSLLFALKAYTIADNSQDVPVSHMSSDEMAAHFAKMFFSFDTLTKEGLKINMQMLDVFLDRHPNDENVLEAYVGYSMIAQQITGEKLPSEKIDAIFEKIQGQNFKVDRLSVLKNVINKDYAGAKLTLDRLNQHYAQEPELQYLYAAYHWKQGDRAQANQYLERAIAMGDKCSYCVPGLYKDTLARLKKAKNGDDQLFAISIGLNFENL